MPMMATVDMLLGEFLAADEVVAVAAEVVEGATGLDVDGGGCELEADDAVDADRVVELDETPAGGGRTDAGATEPTVRLAKIHE